MSLLEITEEIDRIERVKPHLRDLGDVAICDRRLTALRTHRDQGTDAKTCVFNQLQVEAAGAEEVSA